MRTIANEVRPDGITANCIEPNAAGKTGKRSDGQKFLDRRARALGLDEMQGSKITNITPTADALSPFVTRFISGLELKNGLSKADFLTWVDNANDLKQKALCNEIDFNYYLNEIAK